MQNENRKFLEFNGKNINVLAKDGQYWVALKPICEALEVDYEHQRKSIQNDEIMCQLPSIQTVVASDGKLREMLCLPERFIYGWLFSINSKSEELKKYKLACYEVLYNFFHGATTQRINSLRVRSEAEREIEYWSKQLKETEAYKNLKSAEAKKISENKALKLQDNVILESQLKMFETEISN